jgi:hypothetical protein
VSVRQKARNRSPDVRRKGVGRANRTTPKLFEDMLKVNFSDGERNIFGVESHDVSRWGRSVLRHPGGLPVPEQGWRPSDIISLPCTETSG